MWQVRVHLRPPQQLELYPIYETEPKCCVEALNQVNFDETVDVVIPSHWKTEQLSKQNDVFVKQAKKLKKMMVRDSSGNSVEERFPSGLSLERWKLDGNWSMFRDYRYHEYLFPIHLPSCYYRDTFVVTPEVVQWLKEDITWMSQYRKCVVYQVMSWGYNISGEGAMRWTRVYPAHADQSFTNGMSWILRHLLVSLKVFRCADLFEALVSVAQDITTRSIDLLNLDDNGLQEALDTCDGDYIKALQWVDDELLMNSVHKKKWNPTLHELIWQSGTSMVLQGKADSNKNEDVEAEREMKKKQRKANQEDYQAAIEKAKKAGAGPKHDTDYMPQ